jgi:HK97 gp10 family phage protein
VITGYVIGDAQVIAKLKELPQKTQQSLTRAITKLAIELQSKVKQDKLSGQVLKRRTGTLSRSINREITETANAVTGQVGTNVEYAAYHEYGFHGTQQIKEHLRTIKQAFGRPIEPRSVTVAAHSRKVDYPAHSFLRSALHDMDATIRAGIADALHEAIKP